MIKIVTCTECPMGCTITIEHEGNNIISITGNTCPRGKLYAENELICPKRVVTSTIKSTDGKFVPVKTKDPVPKSEIFAVMEKINSVTCTTPIKTGTIVYKNISDGVDLVVAGSIE